MKDARVFSIEVRIVKGAIQMDRDELRRELASWPDGDATLTIENDVKRSTKSNAYLWGPVYGVIHDYTGQPKQDIHDEMCARFTTQTISYALPDLDETIEVEVVRRTSGMTARRFHQFIEAVKLYWQEFAGLTFDDQPDEYWRELDAAEQRDTKKRSAA